MSFTALTRRVRKHRQAEPKQAVPDLSGRTTMAFRLLCVMILLGPIGIAFSTGISAAAVGSPNQQLAYETCSPPVNLRDQAHNQLSELKQLGPEVVPNGARSAIEKRIARGDTSFDLDRYCDARDSYQSALAIATPALREALRADTRQLLNETAGMVEAERADGNPDPDVGSLEAKVAQQRRALDRARTLNELRERHDQAVALQQETEQRLPTGNVEQLLEGLSALLQSLADRPLPTALSILFGSIAAGQYILYRRTESTTHTMSTRDN